MSARKLFDAGFTDLVSVIPPDGELSPRSGVQPEQRGKCPGILVGKTWRGYPFTTVRCDKDMARRLDAQGANVGLLGNQFPALDIDVDDPQLAAVIEKFALRELGEAPVRLSREPRRLLVYRSDEPFGRIAALVTRNGKTHMVECLGKGRQYLVHGRHPAGVDYRWRGIPLWDYGPGDLPIVSAATVRAFFEKLRGALERHGVTCEIVGDAKGTADAPDQATLEAPTIEQLTAVVEKIPNPADADRAHYVQVACAIKAAAGPGSDDVARRTFFGWADRWDGAADRDHDEKTWDSLRPPFRVGWTWLQEQAEAGGDYQSARDEFDADATAVPPVKPAKKLAQADTDEALVAALMPVLGDRLRYVPRSREWYVWGEHRWRRDELLDHEVIVRGELALHSAAWRAQARGASKAHANELKKRVARYQSADGIASVVRLLRAKVSVRPDDFDRDPLTLNTPAGAIDLTSGVCVPARPADMLSRSTRVAAVPGPAPLWDRFLHDLTAGDRALREYLRRFCGYALTGDVSEKMLAFIWGSDSDTGKSTFIRVLLRVLGDYADTVDVQAFIGTGRDRIPAELARMPGVRLVTATEPAAGHSWDEKRIKAITGGDEIEVRFLHGQPFTYKPQFKIVIVGNHEPEIRTVDDAMLRRIHIVPFNNKVARDRQVENLSDLLVDREGPQILAWMLAGCAAWAAEGLAAPDAVVAKTREYERDEDSLQQWIDEQCELGEKYVATRESLYRAWTIWCHERGEEPGKFKAFKRRLEAKRALGLTNTQAVVGASRRRATRGIRLRPAVESGAEDFAE